MRRAAAISALALIGLAGVAKAADAPAWKPFHTGDPVTDATREGVSYEDGDDAFLVVCTHQKDAAARQRFWVAVKTGAHLGQRTVRALTYRIGDEPPTTSRWDYTPREVVPTWPMEDRHLVERIVDGKVERVIFRLFTADGLPHDITVPIDAVAREAMAQTIARCRS